MTAPPPVIQGLFDVAVPEGGSAGDLARVLGDHRRQHPGPGESVLADLVVADQRLADLSRSMSADPVSVCVVNTTGAGGLVALARRSVPGVDVVAVQSGLRDLDDLAGNAARVVSAASSLPESVAVYVEIPHSPGWQRAMETVESAGLLGALRAGPGSHPSAVVEQLSAFVEADLPFRLNAVSDGFLGWLSVIHALVEGASAEEAVELISDPDRTRAAVASWGALDASRVRRRVRRLECASLEVLAAELGEISAD